MPEAADPVFEAVRRRPLSDGYGETSQFVARHQVVPAHRRLALDAQVFQREQPPQKDVGLLDGDVGALTSR